MQQLLCDLDVSADVVRASYAGGPRWLQARARSGAALRFPLQWLRPFVTHSGVKGTFEFILDADNRLKSLRRVDASGVQRSGHRA